MHEILFKGFHPDENGTEEVFVNGKWIKGYWIESNSIWQTKSGTYLYLLGIYRAVLPETVCQYTGLKDKNGKWIFGGDIVKEHDVVHKNEIQIEGDIFQVLFLEGAFWIVDKRSSSAKDLLRNIQKKYEIIGSVHSNPELLEVGE